ncbi:histidinol-phosphate transaminase [uncultured Chloroflexus sp.]|uniref:pyridoxal phosphate-dependent aminotransferase n=1 Tax=uncultured Chloroflexus sp. TaxID=214040 RepID=UPI002601BF6A|nr:histidinol-phosphate transaminase [uncultured Chloroflexus sp.]
MEPHPVTHGALDEAELATLGLRADQVIDFSSNINPFGPPRAVLAALRTLDPAPYPDRSCLRLRQQIAMHHRCQPDAVLVGNGANELIHLAARALGVPGATALVIAPAYGEYAHACRLVGMQVVEVRSTAATQFQPNPAALLVAIERLQPHLLWLCSPNNPTGVQVATATIVELAHACARHGGWLILDRAYLSLLRDHTGHDPLDNNAPANLIRIYSLTKSYAVAGLRIGYLIADPEPVSAIVRFQPAWSVSSAAQAAALAMLADTDFLPTTLPRLWSASDELAHGLHQLGLTVWRSEMPFMLVQCADAAFTRRRLLARGCVVRDCTSFGLSEWVRVAPRRPEDNARLVTAWREIG